MSGFCRRNMKCFHQTVYVYGMYSMSAKNNTNSDDEDPDLGEIWVAVKEK